jgi:translation initiation factor 2 subunit 2|uniref:Translation initiation factor IF2/IF5 domain-containing protein n=1 Tax=viral metagenome TaxID=1070528 RepID=A0A6C0IVN4_9ZZZZ
MSFELRLDELYNSIHAEDNVAKLVLPVPTIDVTTTNTYWPNVKDFLKVINRPPKHFIDFLSEQLGTEVTQKSASLSKGLILIGKQKKQKVVPLIGKYMKEFVVCKFCNSYKSKLNKDDKIRKYIFNCKTCNSSYSV